MHNPIVGIVLGIAQPNAKATVRLIVVADEDEIPDPDNDAVQIRKDCTWLVRLLIVSVAATPPCDRHQRGDDRAFPGGGARWLICTVMIQRSVTPSVGWR